MKALSLILLPALFSGFLALGTATAPAREKYPNRPIRILVPYYDMAYFDKRTGDLEDLVRGDAQAAFLNVGSTAGMAQAGKLRALARRQSHAARDCPNVPTMTEIGYPDVGAVAWNALFAPAATPEPVLEALFKIAAKVMQSPELIEKFKKQNFNVVPSKSLADAHKWPIGEMKYWETVTSAVKIEAPQ
jgi:tripartite-type tricarboxylate transporter receptor subunit TctC